MRLKDRDYSSPGLYFVTICATQMRCIFGRVRQNSVELSSLGHIARECWIDIPRHFVRINLHSFVIMPNHIHGIVEIAATGLAQHAAPPQERETGGVLPGVPVGSLSAIVRSFKGEVTRRSRLELHSQARIWQPNYFDRVIRDGREFSNASRYIAENPLKWEADLENPKVAGVPKVAKVPSEKERLAQHAAPLQGIRRNDR